MADRAAPVGERVAAARLFSQDRQWHDPTVLTSEALDVFSRSVLCWLATVAEDGTPSVSPKEIFTAVSPGEIRIANIASPRSVRNIVGRPQVCVAAVDVFAEHGYQAYGQARIVVPTDAAFAEIAAPLLALAGPYPVKSVISVAVERISRIVSPTTWMFPDRTPQQRRTAALRGYGVQDLPATDSEVR